MVGLNFDNLNKASGWKAHNWFSSQAKSANYANLEHHVSM